jgi:hypothetical protein
MVLVLMAGNQTKVPKDIKMLVISGCSGDALMRCLMISGGSIASVLRTPCISLQRSKERVAMEMMTCHAQELL